MLKLLFTACVFYDGTNEVTQILFKFYSKYFLSTMPHHSNISYCIDIFLFFPVCRVFEFNWFLRKQDKKTYNIWGSTVHTHIIVRNSIYLKCRIWIYHQKSTSKLDIKVKRIWQIFRKLGYFWLFLSAPVQAISGDKNKMPVLEPRIFWTKRKSDLHFFELQVQVLSWLD